MGTDNNWKKGLRLQDRITGELFAGIKSDMDMEDFGKIITEAADDAAQEEYGVSIDPYYEVLRRNAIIAVMQYMKETLPEEKHSLWTLMEFFDYSSDWNDFFDYDVESARRVPIIERLNLNSVYQYVQEHQDSYIAKCWKLFCGAEGEMYAIQYKEIGTVYNHLDSLIRKLQAQEEDEEEEETGIACINRNQSRMSGILNWIKQVFFGKTPKE